MTELIIICGLIIVLGGLFFFLAGQNRRQLQEIDDAIGNEATNRGLKIESIIYPGFTESGDSPFDAEIKIGALGFEGIPYNRQYYRVLKYHDQSSNSVKTVWVRATRNYKTKKVTLEWKEKD